MLKLNGYMKKNVDRFIFIKLKKTPLQMAERPQRKARYTASEEEKAEEMS